jgi:hypothetical protein
MGEVREQSTHISAIPAIHAVNAASEKTSRRSTPTSFALSG